MTTGTFYVGSRLLEPLCAVIPLPIDQLNFLVCQLFSMWFGHIFRTKMSPKTIPSYYRHITEIVVGLGLSYFCFGYQMLHMFAQSTMCYALMKYGPQSSRHLMVFVVGLGYVCVCHIYRQYYDYGGYTMDVTSPLMIIAEKVSSLAWALHDGSVPEETLSSDQKAEKIKELPQPVTFYSYIFCFHGFMIGPLVFFSEYRDFIDGTNYDKPNPSKVSNGTKDDVESPSPKDAVIKKCIQAAIFSVLMVVTPKIVPYDYMFTDEYLYESTFIYRMLYMLVSVTMIRSKYYTAFLLSEAVNNVAGLGFNGYDSNGELKWDLLNNVNIWTLETCTSMKVNIDSWNIRTALWLRRCVYDRVPRKYGVWPVFLVTSLWHGFYPGYYITFLSAAFVITAGRLIRRNIRPKFQTDETLKQIYEVITFIGTRFANVYLCAPHCLLEFMPNLRLYWSQYFIVHVVSAAPVVYYTYINPPKKDKVEKSQ
ncbi:lysophospholipid acyltransferase 6-like [Mytilus californianus]|uniref:lysophospholipid acyltransferase 6-like n=1 Tax=Mytilus californianus TaxID=6549 RepID=UPI002247C1D2|nr:lysophospholipid acyltransferase 6-like [Mytilus californianus]